VIADCAFAEAVVMFMHGRLDVGYLIALPMIAVLRIRTVSQLRLGAIVTPLFHLTPQRFVFSSKATQNILYRSSESNI
jgi:hypothetical protein